MRELAVFLLSEMRILCLLSDFAPSTVSQMLPSGCNAIWCVCYYKEFMDMGCRERDDYLAQEIMKDNPFFLKNGSMLLTSVFNSREIIAENEYRDHASGHRKQDLKRHCEMDARHHLGDDP